jgi:hypothetical protein
MATRFILLVLMLGLVGGCKAEPATPVDSPLRGVLFINEFMASNATTVADEHGDYADWIELYNAGDRRVSLHGYFLTDNIANPMKWQFPDTAIAPGGYLLIWADGEYRQGPLHASFRLDADKGEQVGLFSTNGDQLFLVDTLSYGPQSRDTSVGRIPDGGAEWRQLAYATPWAANISGESRLRGTVFINEFMASNSATIADEAGDYDDWIELFNAGDSAVRLGTMTLTDDLTAPAKWVFPETVLPAGGFLLVWADNEPGEGALHVTFNLGAAVGEQVGLHELSNGHPLVIDSLTFGQQRPDTSFGRLPDGGANWLPMPTPTPRRANRDGR